MPAGSARGRDHQLEGSSAGRARRQGPGPGAVVMSGPGAPTRERAGASGPADLEGFRAKARDWLGANAVCVRRVRPGAPRDRPGVPQGAVGRRAARDHPRPRLWRPGPEPEHQKVFDEEAAGYPLPPIGEAVTTGICAPTLLDFGSEDQKRRHMPRMIRGEEVVDPAALRAGGRVGPGRPADPRRSATGTSTSSTARRSGRRGPVSRTTPSAWPGPTRMSPSTRACRCSSSI